MGRRINIMTKHAKVKKVKNEKIPVEVWSSNIQDVDMEEYTKEKVLKYGINVSVARSCSSLEDGLNPARRRIIWTMYHDHNLLPSGRYVKVPEFLYHTAKYHPHGNLTIENTFGNMVKPWETNAPLLDISGNEGSLTGDESAAPRYLDAKLSLYCYKCFFEEFDQDIVDMVPNYIKTDVEPIWLPSKYPNFLLTLSTGIAWGNSIDIPPFNLTEVFRLTQSLLEHSEMTKVHLFPDSPRGYDIIDDGNIQEICDKGNGTIKIRAKLVYHEDGNYISVTGFPEETAMDPIIQDIHELVQKKELVGIEDVADKSDLENTEFWILLKKKDANPDLIIDTLYKKTKLEYYAAIELNFAERTTMLRLGLKDAILEWIERRIDYKQRLAIKKLSRLKERKHVLEALIAMTNPKEFREVTDIIRNSESDEEANELLCKRYKFTSYQANIVSEIRLKQNNKGRREKLEKEYSEIDEKIAHMEGLVRSKKKIKEEIYDELEEGIKLFGKPRCCKVIKRSSLKKLKLKFRIVVTKRYIKKLSLGNKLVGSIGSDDEIVQYYPVVEDGSIIYLVDEYGKVYPINIDKLPPNDLTGKGTELKSVVGISGDVIRVFLTNEELLKNLDKVRLAMFTETGIIKVTPLEQYIRTKSSIIQGILLNQGDKVCYACLTGSTDELNVQKLIYTKQGMGIVTNLNNINVTDRLTKGTRYLKLNDGDVVKGVCDATTDQVCIITEKGYGKVCDLDEIFNSTKRKADMIRLTGLNDGDEVKMILPVDEVFNQSKIRVYLQSGEKKEIDATDIKKTTRISKGQKLIPVKRGDAIIRIKIAD